MLAVVHRQLDGSSLQPVPQSGTAQPLPEGIGKRQATHTWINKAALVCCESPVPCHHIASIPHLVDSLQSARAAATVPIPRPLQLLAVSDRQRPLGLRNFAIVLGLPYTGLLLAEGVSLSARDVNTGSGLKK